MYTSKSEVFLKYPEYIERQIEYFNNVAWKVNEYDKLKREFNNKISFVYAPVIGLKKGAVLYRARFIENQGLASVFVLDENSFFDNVDKLGINSKERTKSFGRANRPGNPVLYTGFRPETAIREMVQWARTQFTMGSNSLSKISELRAKLIKEGADSDDPFINHKVELQMLETAHTVKNLVVSAWELQEDVNLAYIFDKKLIPDEIIAVIERQNSRIPNDPNNININKSQQLIANFFAQHFVKASTGSESEYMISALGAELSQLTRVGIDGRSYPVDGLLYASVAEGYQGVNCVFNEEAVAAGKIKFVSAECHMISRPEDIYPAGYFGKEAFVGKEAFHSIIARAELISEETGDLTWKILGGETK